MSVCNYGCLNAINIALIAQKKRQEEDQEKNNLRDDVCENLEFDDENQYRELEFLNGTDADK
jgi:hypothetical protein